jgi:hypothetical protein
MVVVGYPVDFNRMRIPVSVNGHRELGLAPGSCGGSYAGAPSLVTSSGPGCV